MQFPASLLGRPLDVCELKRSGASTLTRGSTRTAASRRTLAGSACAKMWWSTTRVRRRTPTSVARSTIRWRWPRVPRPRSASAAALAERRRHAAGCERCRDAASDPDGERQPRPPVAAKTDVQMKAGKGCSHATGDGDTNQHATKVAALACRGQKSRFESSGIVIADTAPGDTAAAGVCRR